MLLKIIPIYYRESDFMGSTEKIFLMVLILIIVLNVLYDYGILFISI